MYNIFSEFIKDKTKICVVQAENPDGDSLGSALALEALLKDKELSLYCPVDIPKYLRYFDGWSRVTNEFDFSADGIIIVDTAAEVLISNPASKSLIRQGKYIQLPTVMLSGKNLGMQTMDAAVKELNLKG